VLDVSQLANSRPPKIPNDAACLFRGGVSGDRQFLGLVPNLKSVLGIPFLGAMSEAAAMRSALENIAPGDRVPPDGRRLACGCTLPPRSRRARAGGGEAPPTCLAGA